MSGIVIVGGGGALRESVVERITDLRANSWLHAGNIGGNRIEKAICRAFRGFASAILRALVFRAAFFADESGFTVRTDAGIFVFANIETCAALTAFYGLIYRKEFSSVTG